MLIGYDRISENEKDPQFHIESLKSYGCESIYTDTNGGSINQRPGLQNAREILCKGDTLVIWRLDRLAKSMKELFEWMEYFKRMDITLISLQEAIDTSAPSGQMIFHIFESLHQFERNLTLERTNPGRLTAQRQGRVGGRPPVISEEQKKQIIELYNLKQMSVVKLCRKMKISKPTLYKIIKNSSSSE